MLIAPSVMRRALHLKDWGWQPSGEYLLPRPPAMQPEARSCRVWQSDWRPSSLNFLSSSQSCLRHHQCTGLLTPGHLFGRQLLVLVVIFHHQTVRCAMLHQPQQKAPLVQAATAQPEQAFINFHPHADRRINFH